MESFLYSIALGLVVILGLVAIACKLLVQFVSELSPEEKRLAGQMAKKAALCYIEHREKKKGEDLRHLKEMLR